MSSAQADSQAQGHASSARTLAIAIPIVAGVALLVAVPFILTCYRRRKASRANDAEKASRGHTRNVSDTSQPLLGKPFRSERLSSVYVTSDDHLPLQQPQPVERAASPVSLPSPLNTHPNHFFSAPKHDSPPSQPQSIPMSTLPQPHQSLERTTTVDLLRRPSYLTHPRLAPTLSQKSQRAKNRGQQPMLARLASARSKRSSHADDESTSPSSVYSQASATTSVWHNIERPWHSDDEAPPVPSLPTIPASPVLGHDYHSSPDMDDNEVLLHPDIKMALPLHYNTYWTKVLGDDLTPTSKGPTVRLNPDSIDSHPPRQVSDPPATYSVPQYGIVSKEGRTEHWDSLTLASRR
ncbi:unnamed protein product [Somion occarium]|uniref:Uncharacterized protein n=1 Tax=Somion occarium TaxID=3059160 RepID=A0ABP1E9B6_9APHY